MLTGLGQTMARLFVISDVLSNCRGNRQGSFQFRKDFQELLPEACENNDTIYCY